jgi:hypothetical protein
MTTSTDAMRAAPQPPSVPNRKYVVTVTEMRPLYRDSKTVVERPLEVLRFNTETLTPWCAVVQWADEIREEEAS